MSPRRKKSDGPTTEVMLQDRTIHEAIADLPRDLQQKMNDNVWVITKVVVRTYKELVMKYDAVSELILYNVITPKKGDTIIKAISGSASAMEKFLTTEWPDKIKEEVAEKITAFKEAYFAAAKAHMEPDQYTAFRKRFEDAKSAQ